MLSLTRRLFNIVKSRISQHLSFLISPGKRFLHKTRKVSIYANQGRVDEAKTILFAASKGFILSVKCISKENQDTCVDALMARDTKGNLDKETKNSLVKVAETIADSPSTGTENWKPFWHFFQRNGFFVAAQVVRNKAAESIISLSDSGLNKTDQMISALKASLELNDLTKAGQLLMAEQVKKSDSFQWLNSYCSFLTNSAALSSGLHTAKADKRFADYIVGKRVAVVGPAPSFIPNGAEIDEFEIVVRVNYLKTIPSERWSDIGSKTDISYYGNVFTKQIDSKINDFVFSENLRFLVFKSKIPGSLFQSVAQNSDNLRYFQSPKMLFFNGSPMMIQNILFDLLLHKPGAIKLFNTTFYLGANTHFDGYHNLWTYPKNDSFKDIQGFAHHDIVSNFMFIKTLFENKQIEADEACKEVLQLSKEEFVKALEGIHSF